MFSMTRILFDPKLIYLDLTEKLRIKLAFLIVDFNLLLPLFMLGNIL